MIQIPLLEDQLTVLMPVGHPRARRRSHFRSGNNPETAEAEQILQRTFGRGRWRTDAEIAALLEGLDLVEPGIVSAPLWRPDTVDSPWNNGDERELTVWESLIAAALARKP